MNSIGKTDEFAPGSVRRFQIGGRSVAVANVDGQLYAFDDICTHRGCSLADGMLDGLHIVCPCHSSVFRVSDGRVMDGPAEEDIEVYPLEVVEGQVSVSTGTPAEPAEASAPSPRETGAQSKALQAQDAPAPAGAERPAESLKSVPLFAGLDQATLESLEAFTFRKSFAADEVIMEEGRTGNGLYIVLSGRVEVIKGLGSANPQVAAVLEPGEPFGEMALLGDWKRSASVRAMGEVECLGMDRWAFLAHLNREPQLAVRMLQMLAERLAETNEKLVD